MAMKPVLRHFLPLWVCLVLVTCACVSLSRVEGYRPGGPGTPEIQPCTYVEDLRVPLAGNAAIVIGAAPRAIYPDPDIQIDLGIRVLVGGDAEVQLLSPDLWLASREWPRPRRLPVARIVEWTKYTRVLPVDADLRGSEDSSTYGYILAFTAEGPRGRTSIPAPDAFRLQMPDIRVNGRRVRIDAIQFERFSERKIVVPCD
jgi:hypothetical protein